MDDFSEDGVATLKFNTPVKVPSVTEVLDSRVALRMTKAITSNDPIYETYETADGLADFQIRDAIEVKMIPGDDSDEPVDIDFTWEFIKFEPYEVQIQLYFDTPESISPDANNPDNVMITFWAGDLFEAENGKNVRPGLTIRAPVIRQVKPDDTDLYKDIGKYSGIAVLGIMLLGFLVAWRM